MNRTLQPPPAAAGCRRVQMAGLFLLQPITSILVDVGGSSPSIRLRQGEIPESWLRPPVQTTGPRISIAPAGLILFGGGGRVTLSDFSAQMCGDVTGCNVNDSAFSYTGGGSFWFSQYVAAEVSYLRPGRMTADGSGQRFRFESEMDGGLVSVVGKGAVPIGRVRLFGLGGAAYHRATFTTSETIEATTVTVDGVSQAVPGGTPRFQWRTEGWGLAVGGGAEVWITEAIGLYGEFARLGLKGDDTGNGEAATDDMLTSIVVGLRVRFPFR
jgi:hypothetical protein